MVSQRRIRLMLGFFLIAWLASAPVVFGADNEPESDAAQAEAEGDSAPDADTGTGSGETEDPAVLAMRAEQMERAQALVEQIEALSYDVGSYDPTLIELQEDLGRTWLALEQYERAHEVLEQAMQLVRVNDGLYSERQIALLQQLVQANMGRREWEQADVFAHLVFDLQSRIHPAESSEYADALIALSDWKLQAARHNLLPRSGSQQTLLMLSDLQDQHEAALAYARDREDVDQQWSLLYAKARADVEVARRHNYQSLTEFGSASPRFTMQTRCGTVPDGAGGVQRVCWQERTSNQSYLYSASNERRRLTDRARMSLQATTRELKTLLEENPGFAAANQHTTDQGLENIDRALAELERQARRATIRELRQW